MKKLLFLSFVLFVVTCSKNDINLETFSPEAFAYDLGDKWEVNAIVNVRGFEQREGADHKSFEASINLSADFKTPDGKLVEDIFADTINVSHHEEILDIPLEVQFELDSTYSFGEYQIIIHITDSFSKNHTTATVEFNLKD